MMENNHNKFNVAVTPKGVELLSTMVNLGSFDMLEPKNKQAAAVLFKLQMFQPMLQVELDELVSGGYIEWREVQDGKAD